MWEEILKTVTLVYFPSMLKFIFGPIAGYAAGLSLLSTVLGTVAGTMTIVLLFTYSGNWIRNKILNRFSSKSEKSNRRNQKFIAIWKKYGLTGVAFLTPLILTPIGGTLLAVSSGSPKEKIIFYMFLSASAWALTFSVIIYFFGNEFLPDFIKP
jgi:hypothetical protein